MDFDTQLLLDYFIPDSPSDAGALIFWALLFVLAVIITVDLRLYLRVRKTTHTQKKPIQGHPTEEQMRKLTDEPTTDIKDIRQKVDRLIQLNNL